MVTTVPILYAIIIAITALGFSVKKRNTKTKIHVGDGGSEGVVEQYILAMEAVEEELRMFYENAAPSMEPDPHTDVQENFREMCKKLRKTDLSEKEINELLRTQNEEEKEIREEVQGTRRRTILAEGRYRWDKGIIPFLYTSETTATGQIQIERAMHVYERFTCIRYKPWINSDGVTTNERFDLGHPGHLRFVANAGCWSLVGNLRKSAGQTISCCGGTTCIHELGHALGLVHEQQSPNPDRNWIIRVNNENIKPDSRKWYVPVSDSTRVLNFGYDLSSYMHYGTLGFAIGSAPTFSILVRGLRERTGHYYLMMTVSLAYKCEELYCSNLTSTLTCHNDGYLTLVDGKCACRCLPGLDPDTGCTTIYKSDPPHLMFPSGKYAVPAPASGCPGTGFHEGSRTHYNDGGNKRSIAFSLKGIIRDQSVEESFCVSNSTSSATKWPNGNYCIYRKGGACPDGFKEGFVQYDDKEVHSMTNKVSGELPDGVFNKNTRFEFCCQRHGLSRDEIFLPSREPLVLIKHPLEDCQKIRGMHVTIEYIKIDNSEDERLAASGGDNPIYKINSRTNGYWTRYCSYTPAVIDCGDVIELDENNPTATITSPNAGNELECYWLIKVPAGERIYLDFASFSIKGTQGHCVDEVEIRCVRPGQPGVIFCGTKMKKTIISINNTIHIRMSTFGNSESSFSAVAKFLKNADSCYNVVDRGTTYAGKVNFTIDFEKCLPWKDVMHCPYHAYNTKVLNTLLTENYCRNPDFDTGIQPWCYTSTKNCIRNYCDVCLTGKRFDRRNDCSKLKRSGFCSQPTALANCAKTCEKEWPNHEVPVKVSINDSSASSVMCGQPDPVTDGTVVGALENSYSVGQKVIYKCNYQNNTKERVCLTSGKWSPLGFVCGECPNGWHTFNGNCYGFFLSTKTFPDAVVQCSEFGAIVSPAKSQEENDFISTLAQGRSVWIGISDEDVEGTWIFTDGEKGTWSNWYIGQPDNWGSNQDCAAMLHNGKWNDLYCTAYFYPFVCKKPRKVSENCLDFWDQCGVLFASDPNMCTSQHDFAQQQCAFTCGFCSQGSAISCPVDIIKNSKTDEQRSSVPVGQVVTFTCDEGYVQISGDSVRSCQTSGSLTGKPLACSKAPNCPNGWSFYNLHCYKFYGGKENYAKANEVCSRERGILANAKSEAEQNFVHSLRNPSYSIWLGLDDINSEGFFHWSDGEIPGEWNNWKSGQPNNYGYGQDCVVMRPDKLWDDISCFYSYTYVCKAAVAAFQCPVDFPQPNSHTDEIRTSIAIGETVTYACDKDFVISSGDSIRQCGESGSLSGEPLICVQECPAGWKLNQENNLCYKYFEDRTVYTDAVKACSNYNGFLAMPKNVAQLQFIHDVRPTKADIWLGINDNENEGTWLWADSTPVIGWNNWERGEPNNWNSDEDCGLMLKDKKWNDVHCNSKNNFVCEVSIKDQELSAMFTACPSGWHPNMKNKQCYRYIDQKLSYSDAKFKCASFQSTLAMPKIQSDIDFISNVRGKKTIWLGLDEISDKGIWKWADGQIAKNSTNWILDHHKTKRPHYDCAVLTCKKQSRCMDCRKKFRIVCQVAVCQP